MDKKEEKMSQEGCRIECCSGAKLALGLLLILIGGIIGYCAGHCSGYRKACASGMGMCPYSQSAPPPPTPGK